MNRSTKLFFTAATALAASTVATPAFAQYSSTSSDDAAGAAVGIGMLCCYGIGGIIALVLFVLWVWMLIDTFSRQDHEFPTGNKSLWIIVHLVAFFLGFWGITAIVYYFMVYKKVKRGSVPAPVAFQPAAGAYPTPGAPPAPYAPPAPPMAPPAPPAPPMAPPAPPAAPEPPAPPSDQGPTG